MDAFNALGALKTMTAIRTPRTNEAVIELCDELDAELETVTEFADAVEEKVTALREFIDELREAERADRKDFTQSVRTACEELTELLTV